MIGSAVLFTVANAIGAAPTMITPSAAIPAITRSGAPAKATAGAASHPGRRCDGAAAGSVATAVRHRARSAGCPVRPR